MRIFIIWIMLDFLGPGCHRSGLINKRERQGRLHIEKQKTIMWGWRQRLKCGHQPRSASAGCNQKLGAARDGFSPSASWGSLALPTPWFQHRYTSFGLGFSELWRNKVAFIGCRDEGMSIFGGPFSSLPQVDTTLTFYPWLTFKSCAQGQKAIKQSRWDLNPTLFISGTQFLIFMPLRKPEEKILN